MASMEEVEEINHGPCNTLCELCSEQLIEGYWFHHKFLRVIGVCDECKYTMRLALENAIAEQESQVY